MKRITVPPCDCRPDAAGHVAGCPARDSNPSAHVPMYDADGMMVCDHCGQRAHDQTCPRARADFEQFVAARNARGADERAEEARREAQRYARKPGKHSKDKNWGR